MNKRTILILLVLCQMLSCFAIPASASGVYCINDVCVACEDFTSRPGNCRAYAEKLYEKIWGTGFSSDFYDDDNMLRNLEDEDLVLTEEHLKEYISQAELGSAFRVSSKRFLHRNDGSAGHTQLIVQKDENGFTVLEGGMRDYPYRREYYYTWSEFVSTHWLGGQYGYIKYIKWPGAPEYDENYDVEPPEISGIEVNVREDGSGFTASFRAVDDTAVEQAYIRVWPQNKTAEDAAIYPCTWDGRTGKAEFTAQDDTKVYYLQCCASDARGNIGGEEQEAELVSLYVPDVGFLGICQVTSEDAVICDTPSGLNPVTRTRGATTEPGTYLYVEGIYRDGDGTKWYALPDGQWICESDVRYNTFLSFINWAFAPEVKKSVLWRDGQVLFAGD